VRISQDENHEGRPYTTLQARVLFFEAISRLAPQVPSELADSVLPVFGALYRLLETNVKAAAYRKEAAVRYGTARVVESHIDLLKWHKISSASPGLYPDLIELRESLVEWATRYKIAEPWCYQTALETLELWGQREDARDALLWRTQSPSSGERQIQKPETMFRFETSGDHESPRRGYDPLKETHEAACARLKNEFAEGLTEYLDRLDLLASERGGDEVSDRVQRHFEWLVRFQLLGETFIEIGTELVPTTSYFRTRVTVRTGVHDAAGLIGLRLRDPA
jgi:hypothetical protein